MKCAVGLFALALLGCSSSASPTAPKGAHDAGPTDGGRDADRVDATPRDARRSDAEDAARRDAPSATTLSIAPLTLTPAFDVSIHDYYVRCAAGTNALTVHATAAPGSTIALTKPTTTLPGVDETTLVSVDEGGVIVAEVAGEAGSDAYWVRCLPHDFPELLMTRHPDAGTPTPGYYLVGDVVQALGEGGYAIAVDGNGVPVWYRTTVTNLGAVDVQNIAPGTISFVPNLNDTYASYSGQFEVDDLVAGTRSTVQSVGIPLDMHELVLLSNGDYLVLSDPITTGVDLTGLESFGPEEDVVGCVIQEISPSGSLVWSWDITDHFDMIEDSTWPQTYVVDGKTVVDPFHCNSIDVDADGNLLVSSRHMDSVFLVSRPSGVVTWKMGGVKASKDNAAYITVTGDPLTSFYRQHDVRFASNGQISMFDDQTEAKGPARAVIYSYDVASGTATFVWQYQGTATALAMGSFRILSDGSRVIGWGVGWGVLGPDNRGFTEVDENGNDLLDFGFPDGDYSYRALKVPVSAFDIGVLRQTAGAP